MTTPHYPTFTDLPTTSQQNTEALKKMYEVVYMFQGNQNTHGCGLDETFEMLTGDHGIDGFELEAEMLNQFIQAFPEMRDAWAKLSVEQKWIFAEGVHYGIRPLINRHLGFEQTC